MRRLTATTQKERSSRSYLQEMCREAQVTVDYPLTVPGLSHLLALVYGRIAVESAVRGESR